MSKSPPFLPIHPEMASRIRLLAPLAAACLAAACATESVRTPAGGIVAVVEHADAAKHLRFETAEGRVLGELVHFQSPEIATVAYWSVRNRHGQELGLVDRLGRAWRRRPHAEPEWLMTGTVEEGARMILGVPPEALLVEVSLDSLAR